MSQIYIRSGISPFNQPSLEEVMVQNLIGGNSGNLIFAYSIYRTLMAPGVEFLPNQYSYRMEDVDYINHHCDYFIIPLADMFREDGVQQMEKMTRFIKKLTIPCIIAGVGLRAPLGSDIDAPFAFDPVVKDFLNEVKKRSALIGVRGETTGRYLQRFGYKEDQDYMVIGCPSMFSYGDYLPGRKLNLDKQSPIAVNCSHISPQSSYDFLANIMDRYENAVFLPQRVRELWLLYGGMDMDITPNRPKGYPMTINHPYYQQKRVKMFINAQSWIDYLKGVDLSVGSRFHGSVASILAGTPTILICHDNRMKELAEYHHIPHIMEGQLHDGLSLEMLTEQMDFDAMFKHHKDNYYRYKKFLKINGVRSLFDENDHLTETLFDRIISKMDLPGEVPSAAGISCEELSARWDRLYHCRGAYKEFLMKRIHKDKTYEHDCREKEIADLTNEISCLTEEFNLLNESSPGQETRRVFLAVKDKLGHIERTNYDRARLTMGLEPVRPALHGEENKSYPLDELKDRMRMNFHPMEDYMPLPDRENPLQIARDAAVKLMGPEADDTVKLAKLKQKLLEKLKTIDIHEGMSYAETVNGWHILLVCRQKYRTFLYNAYRDAENEILYAKYEEKQAIRQRKNKIKAEWRMLNYSKVSWDIRKLLLKYRDAITGTDRDNLARAIKVIGHNP